MKKFLVLTRVQLRALLSTLRIGGSRKRAASGWGALALAAGALLAWRGGSLFAVAVVCCGVVFLVELAV